MSNYPEVDHPVSDKSRLGGFGPTYFAIAQKEYSAYVDLDSAYEREENEADKSEIEDKAFECGLKTILFSALCAEASINDYAAWQLGDKYFESHLASMDTLSKWVVIPALVCGRSIDKSGAAYGALNQLLKSRNLLVHNKSVHLDLGHPELHLVLEKRNSDFWGRVDNAYKALLFLSFECDLLLGPRFNPIGTLDKRLNLMFELPANLLDIFSRCKGVAFGNAS